MYVCMYDTGMYGCMYVCMYVSYVPVCTGMYGCMYRYLCIYVSYVYGTFVCIIRLYVTRFSLHSICVDFCFDSANFS